MRLIEKLSDFFIGFPKVVVYGNCNTCLVKFGSEMKVYKNLRDVKEVVGDFDLKNRRVNVVSGDKLEYEGIIYHGMRPIILSNFREWLRKEHVNVKR